MRHQRAELPACCFDQFIVRDLTLPRADYFAVVTRPIARRDLDRIDDSDNRPYGVTAQIMWVLKPACHLTLRAPLCFARILLPVTMTVFGKVESGQERRVTARHRRIV
ncbi:MAG: hypothetical protein GY844_15970 [Bradyrhizobium sp.]|nr:hypothetical protein [Bradyrhizobium sp.]